jgi:hypothetical protein
MITESLRPLARKGVLYGSQVCRPSLDRDIDVFVISGKENVGRIFHTVAHLQMVFSQIVHVVVVSDPDLERNPSWLALIEHGVVLWEDESDSRRSHSESTEGTRH